MGCNEYALMILVSFLLSSLICLSSFDINRATDGVYKIPSEEFVSIPNQQSRRITIS